MTAEKIPNEITFRNARISFVELNEAKAYGDNPTKYFTLEVLLDRTNEAHAKDIAWVKSTAEKVAVAEYGSIDVVEKVCFGNGDKRTRRGSTEVYDGYAGMFYVKTKGKVEQAAPGMPYFGAVMDRRVTRLPNGNIEFIRPGHPEWPYSGCYANVKVSIWALSKKTVGYKKGGPYVGANLLAIQFARPGQAFGRGPVSVDEFEALPEDANAPPIAAQASAGVVQNAAWD
jgi:hypothetical protein